MRTQAIASLDDIVRIESEPYASFMPHASVYGALSAVAARFGDRRALTFVASADDPGLTRSWTYRAWLADVERVAGAFEELADGAPPRVAMLLPAVPEAYLTLWGGTVGGIVCPINYLLEVEHIVELVRASDANVLVTLGPTPELDIWTKAARVRERCPGLKATIVVGDAGAPGTLRFDAVMATCRSRIDTRPAHDGDRPAALFHTGGTTGAPKLVKHTHRNQLHAAWSAALMYAMTERDVIISGFPLFHVAGSIVYGLSALLSGAEIVLPTLLGLRNPAMVRRYWDVVQRHRVTVLAAVPTVISTLANVRAGAADLSSVRLLLTGGSPLPSELATSFEERFSIPVRNILGMTECAGVVSIEPALGPRVPGSCGLRLPFTQVEAVQIEAAGRLAPCPFGVPGILRLLGPNVSPGYTDALRDRGVFEGDGWLTSGDLGHLDAEGRIFVTGRSKDLIIRSGHNIEPETIEDALMRHPAVQFAAAVGEPDEYAGELPVAYVVLRDGEAASAEDLLEFVRPWIHERPAWPRRIEMLPALPLTAVGKVYKPALRRRAIEHAISERLTQKGLGDCVAVRGREIPGGLELVFSRTDSETGGATEASVKAIMSPFAIAWSWS